MTTDDNPLSTFMDKVYAAVERDRLSLVLVDQATDLAELDPSEWLEALTSFAEHLERSREALEEWAQAEERDVKKECREDALAALNELQAAWEATGMIPPAVIWEVLSGGTSHEDDEP